MDKGLRNLITGIKSRFRTSTLVLEEMAEDLNEDFPDSDTRAIPEYKAVQEALKNYENLLISKYHSEYMKQRAYK